MLRTPTMSERRAVLVHRLRDEETPAGAQASLRLGLALFDKW